MLPPDAQPDSSQAQARAQAQASDSSAASSEEQPAPGGAQAVIPEAADATATADSGSDVQPEEKQESEGGGMVLDQDLSQPPQYEVEDAMSLQDAVSKVLFMGLPVAAAFALVAFTLWRSMNRNAHRFAPVASHEI